MLPKFMDSWKIIRPKSREDEGAQESIEWYLKNGYSQNELEKLVITEEEAMNVLDTLGINNNSAFYTFYSKFSGVDSSEWESADLMYNLDEVLEDYKQPFWGKQYPNIEKRYLQLSSIEGEYSYFYDKETDALYGVDWGEMDDFMAGKLKPLFTSFYDFLEWYYSEDNE